MRLDWIFLPKENPCAKFYIIIIYSLILPANIHTNDQMSITGKIVFTI